MYFTKGTFMDGAIYAALSRNLSMGQGSFWDPYLTEFFFKSFHEHPPLVFGFQAFFFKVFGDQFWIENLYSALFLVATILLIKAFWKDIFPMQKEAWWWPTFLFALTPTITWSFGNNMLENTMGFFAALAVFSLFKQRESLNFKSILIGALFLVLAFYSKGPTSLFPLATPFFIWLFYRKQSFGTMVLWTLALLAVALLLFLSIYFGSEAAASSWDSYINKQVFGTLAEENPTYSNGRTFILQRLVLELLIPIVLSLFLILYYRIKKHYLNVHLRHFGFFISTGLSAVLPIMISPKQWSFYTVPAIIYMVLALAIISYPYLKIVLTGWNFWVHKAIRLLSWLGFAAILIYGITIFGQIGRDKDKLESVTQISEVVPEGSIVSADVSLKKDWGLLAYFARYHNLSLDFDNQDNQYFISKSSWEGEGKENLVLIAKGDYLKLYERK